MRIAIDCRRILPGMSGLGSYTLQLVSALAAQVEAYGTRITAFLTEEGMPYSEDLQNHADCILVKWPVENHVKGEFWKHLTLPVWLDRNRFDLFHDPAFQLPLRPSCARYVVTIHDLSPFRHPETNTLKYNVYWKFMTRQSIRRAARIIAVSEFTRSEIEDLFPDAASRIDVVPEAAAAHFIPGDVDHERLERLGIRGRYLLTTARYEPRKNLERCLEAFGRGPAHRFADLSLVVAGGMGWKTGGCQRLLARPGIRERIVSTGYLDTADLVNVMRGAEAMVIPSLYEGFGLPVLEAMACGTPVICSRAASLPEIGGNAAYYFDPCDVDSIADVMTEILSDKTMMDAMRIRGIARSQEFSWDRAASATLEVYRKACESDGKRDA